MFANNRLWIHDKRGYAPEQTTSRIPRGDVLVDGAPLPSGSGQAGSGPGMKPGAGGKPQGYDSYGRYTGPRGGSVSLRDGSSGCLPMGRKKWTVRAASGYGQ